MDVSRTTIRDAINKLVVMGFLEQKQGQGTYVRSRDSIENNPLAVAMESQDATLIDMLEVRMGLECQAAALAARRAVEKDIHFLEKSILDMSEEVESGRLGTEADVSFHMAISYATKNPLQIYIMKNFYDLLFVGIRENLSMLYKDPVNIKKIIEQHTNILETIRRHDPETARRAMENHINFVLAFFKSL
jgi:GntR family transcriptional repressor for pyruvate dehydrogenase complex